MKLKNKTPCWLYLFIIGIVFLYVGISLVTSTHRSFELAIGALSTITGMIITGTSFIMSSGKIPYDIYKFKVHVYKNKVPLNNHVDFVVNIPDEIKTQLKKKYGRNPFKKSRIIIEEVNVFSNNTDFVHTGMITGYIKGRGHQNTKIELANISFDEEIKNIINQKMSNFSNNQ